MNIGDFSSQVLPAVTIDFLFHDLYRRSFPQRLDPELLRRYNFYNPIPEGFVRCSFIAIGFLHCSSRRLHFFSFSVILDACNVGKSQQRVHQREWINNRVPKENVSKSAERSVCFPFIVKTREDAVFGNKPVILVS